MVCFKSYDCSNGANLQIITEKRIILPKKQLKTPLNNPKCFVCISFIRTFATAFFDFLNCF